MTSAINDEPVRFFSTEIFKSGLHLPATLHWRNDQLWFSCLYERALFALDMQAETVDTLAINDRPAGFGWLSDGRLIVCAREQKALLCYHQGALVEYADLEFVLDGGHLVDMSCSQQDDIYLSISSLDETTTKENHHAHFALLTAKKELTRLANCDSYPYAIALSPAEDYLYYTETFSASIAKRKVAPDGQLAKPEVVYQFDSLGFEPSAAIYDDEGSLRHYPAGFCFASSGIWCASPKYKEVLLIDFSGSVQAVVKTKAKPFDVTLGDVDGQKKLFISSSNAIPTKKTGLIEMVSLND